MAPLGWFIAWVFLNLHMSVCSLEISRYDSDGVICSQGLSECTMMDEFPLLSKNDAVDVQDMKAYFKLCSKSNEQCTLCLEIDTDFNVPLDNNMENEGHSGQDEEDDPEETKNKRASVTVCYHTTQTIPACKKVEFTVNHTTLAQQNPAKISMLITDMYGVFFSSKVFVYFPDAPHVSQEIDVPSLDTVCLQEVNKCVDECRVPKLGFEIRKEMDHVEVQFDGWNNSLSFVCVQYEQNGLCQRWKRRTIPLYSVTPCMCLQASNGQSYVRAVRCPFTEMEFSQRNLWQNVSVSVASRQTNDYSAMLAWNISAPCRLKGEVWPCYMENSCREVKGFRQQLSNRTWKQNSKGLWVKMGAFEDIDLQLSTCVMVKLNGMRHELGPFCLNDTERFHWSLLLVGGLLLVCLIVLLFYSVHGFIKKWVWSWKRGRFVKIGRKGRVVLLSPPDMDDDVSESICRLGSLLCSRGFSVSVDQWSRKEQCAAGLLPWLYSQLLEPDSQGSRIVLVLSQKALERAEEWAHQHGEIIKTREGGNDLPRTWSPYSDLFTACLCLIQADKQHGRTGERFLLLDFDSCTHRDRNLPKLLQGFPLFQLPTQTQAFLTELTVGGTERTSGGKTWSGWKWGGSDGWRVKSKEESDQQKTSLYKCLGVDKNLETKPLKQQDIP